MAKVTKDAIDALCDRADVRETGGRRTVMVRVTAPAIKDNGVRRERGEEFPMEASLAVAHVAAGVCEPADPPPAKSEKAKPVTAPTP